MRREYQRGSYTVEAALIMPVILFIVIALCYMAFYMHDKIRIQSILDSALLKEGMYLKHESEFATGKILYEQLGERGIGQYIFIQEKENKEEMEEYLRAQLKDGLYITHIKSIEIMIEPLEVEAVIYADIRFPFHKIRSYFSGKGKQMVISNKVQSYHPAEFVWGYTALNQVLTETEGYEKIKMKLNKIINMFRQGL